MKLNKIFMALAATAMVGCSSEDVMDFSANQAVEDSNLIQLSPDFALAGVGDEGNLTRTHWEFAGKSLVNKFLPIYSKDGSTGDLLNTVVNVEDQAVGLCWLGQGAVGTDVYTNYQFYHFGWLNDGAENAEFECNELTNGAWYDEISLKKDVKVDEEAVPDNDFTLPAKSAAGLNYNSGVYKTDNKAIFGGRYIVYYPFNKDFIDAGKIPALAETKFDKVPTALTAPALGKATFRYSAPVDIKGGDQAAGFGLKNLSSLVQLRVAAPKGYTGTTKFNQIVLYSEKQQLLKQANLAADKIDAGKEGTDLYASSKGTKTIVANFETEQTLTATDGTVTSAYITALPTTVEDLVVLVYSNSLQKWAKVSLPNTEFVAGGAKRLDITVDDDAFKSEFIAVDEESLVKAMDDARAVATAENPQTIQVIGDITMSGDKWFTGAKDAYITITGDDIIVPEDAILRLKTNVESDIRVLGKSCCSGSQGGRLVVYGGTISNVTMEPTKATVKTPDQYNTYNPEVNFNDFAAVATVAAGKKLDAKAGNVIVSKSVQHKGDINIAKGVTLTVNGKGTKSTGDLNFMGSKVDNYGTIEVKKDAKFDITDKDGNATATDGQNMTNYAGAKFIHNVDAGVGTAVQKMNQNGEYRCRVNKQTKLDDAFLQWTACSVIEMVNTSAENYNLGTASGISPNAYKHNGKYIDIEVNSGTATTTFTNPATADTKNIQIGNLTVTAGGLNITYVTNKRTLTVNGNMTVKANTTITSSKKINVTGNLTVEGTGVTLTYEGAKANVEGFEVTGDINVSGATFDAGAGDTSTDPATYDASDVDALNITCANFYLTDGATAWFGNRTNGDTKNLVVSGTISNPAGCTFNIVAANQVGTSVLAWVTCKALKVGGTFSAARPRVE